MINKAFLISSFLALLVILGLLTLKMNTPGNNVLSSTIQDDTALLTKITRIKGVSNADVTNGPKDAGLLNAGWWYTWSADPKFFDTAAYPSRFIPLIACGKVPELTQYDPYYKTYTGKILVFNEPDNPAPFNSCPDGYIAPATAAKRLYNLKTKFPSLQVVLGGVGTWDEAKDGAGHPRGIYWLDSFRKEYKQLYKSEPPVLAYKKHCYLERNTVADLNYCKGGQSDKFYGFTGLDLWKKSVGISPLLWIDSGASHARCKQGSTSTKCADPQGNPLCNGNQSAACYEQVTQLFDWVSAQSFVNRAAWW
ncbi:hypothetical protein HYW29_00275, partial [Candidatus Amesbacteria bacterium]|nr:hypothetical protein [Candidatus Amesbacteria bacterium]